MVQFEVLLAHKSAKNKVAMPLNVDPLLELTLFSSGEDVLTQQKATANHAISI